MQFLILLKKNFTWYKRNWKTSVCELLLPIIFILLTFYIRSKIEIIEIPSLEIPRLRYLSTPQEWKDNIIANFLIQAVLKECDQSIKKGGRIALAPKNELTEELGNLLKPYANDIIFFNSDSEINEYTQIEDYTGYFKNGTRKQLCYGISFNEYNIDTLNFDYNLRYNISSSPDSGDHYNPNLPYKIPYKIEDVVEALRIVQNGSITLQFIIDGFILKKYAQIQELNFGIQKMINPSFRQSDFYSGLGFAIVICFVLIMLFVYLRTIGFIVGEKEKKIIQNMENMGMKRYDYFFSIFAMQFIIHFFYGFIFCFLIKFGVLIQANFFIILFAYWLSIINIVCFAFFVSCFFSNSKKSIISGLIIFFILFMSWFLKDTFKEGGKVVNIILALSPITSLSNLLGNILILENTFISFEFSDLYNEVDYFKGIWFFTISIVEIILCFIFGFYFFHIVSNKDGLNYHPLFFLGYPKKEKNSNKVIEDSEKFSLNNNKNNKYFEKIEEKFKTYRKENKTLNIENLTKNYNKKKRAVNNLNIEFYSNQIFSFLGHNGAGKTTTISMISGLLKKSSGKITIFGLDSEKDRNEIKKIIGICPQKNPIFDYMTVEEHLILYAKLKGVKENINNEIEEVLKDIDLYHKKNYIAKNLSGGQKRKLVVAIAFIGNSKIILLDEPTAGLDTYARRLLWKMIKKYKKDRLIILTTHHMDEADYLGDRIGIMNNGELITCGSSLFLKNIFGSGYELTIVKNNYFTHDNFVILEKLFFDICKKFKLTSDLGKELKFLLPKEESKNFRDLFEVLENKSEELNIESFGISLSTLEEVFINVVDIIKKNNKDDDIIDHNEIDIINKEKFDMKNKEKIAQKNKEDFIKEIELVENNINNSKIDIKIKEEKNTNLKKSDLDNSKRDLKNNNSRVDFYQETINSNEKTININKSQDIIKIENDDSDIKDKYLKDFRIKSKKKIFFLQIKALIKKRFLYFSRDITSLLCELFLPVVIVIIGLSLTKIKFLKDPESLIFSPKVYPEEYKINDLIQNDVDLTKNLISNFDKNEKNSLIIKTNSREEFNQDLFKNSDEDQNFSYYLESLNNQNTTYTVFFNSTAPFAANIAINQINEGILRLLKNNNKANLKTRFKPFPHTQGVKTLEGTIDGFIATLLLSIAFSFIPASIIVFIIKERENNSKHQQLISGISPFAYWISNFIVDFLKYLIPGFLTFFLCFAFKLDFFLENEKYAMNLLLIIFFGFAFIPFMYFVSFFFKNPSKGQIFIFLTNFVFGIVLIITAVALRVLEDTRDLTINVLDFIFRLIPFFSFAYGFINMASDKIYKFLFKWEDSKGPFTTYISLYDLMFLIIMGFFYIFCLIIVEFSFKLVTKVKLKNPEKILKEINHEKKNMIVDNNVYEEEKLIESLKEDDIENTVIVKNLIKSYNLKNFGLCGKKNESYKLAVKKINFSVKKGTIFGLLGTNGAGKSTTFKILTGEVYPSFGEAIIMGLKMPTNLHKIRHLIGYCPQSNALFENLTVLEHLNLYSSIKGISKKYKNILIEKTINILRLEKFKKTIAKNLSGGNKRKLNVAIAIIGKPPILFLDEPSSGMDPEARYHMWKVINEISKESSIILTTHSMEEAEAISTKLALMVEGHIKTIGSVQQLKSKYGECFELEIKIVDILKDKKIFYENKINNSEIFDKKNLNENEIENLGLIDFENLEKVLEILGKNEFYKEFSENGKGFFIYKQIKKNKNIEINLLFEWIDFYQKFLIISEFIKEKFKGEIIETFENYLRFKLPIDNKLSNIFGEIEKKLDLLFINNYSIKAISLDQIFYKFAKNVEHDD